MGKILTSNNILSWTCLILLFISCNNAKHESVVTKRKTLNDSLVKELNSIRRYDQEHRADTSSAGRLTQAKDDALNLHKIENLLNIYGWPDPETIGEYGSETILLVLQHSHISVQRKYLPMARRAVIEGKLSGRSWVLLEDRVSLATTGKQLFGTQVKTDQKTGKYYIAPIKDEMNVNDRRKKIGLESLEQYAASWGIKYTIEN